MEWKYHFGYTLLFFIQYCQAAVQIYEIDEDKEVHQCVVKMLQRIELANATDVTLINVNASLTKELHSLLEHPVRFISRSYYWPNDTMFNDVYVIQCSDMFSFLRGLDLVKRDPFWNPRAKFVIIIQYIEDYVQDVSDFLIYNHIYDVTIVTYDEDNIDIVVYTFRLERDECDRPVYKKLELLSRCSEVHNVTNIYMTSRQTSLRGCHVKFVSHNYDPFVSFNGKLELEQYMLDLIRQYENITVEIVNFGKIEHFGRRLDNFTYTGMLHEIEIYNVEGAMGGYVLTLNRMTNLDFIYPFMVDHYKIVLARAKLLGKWGAVLKQLGVLTVWAIFGTFCIFSFIVVLMGIFRKHRRDSSRDVLIVWGYFLNNISPRKDVKTGIPYRLVILNILVYVFILSCATQASLLSATTTPFRGYQPNTVEEVVSNYKLVLSPNIYSYLQTNPIVDFTNAEMSCNTTLQCMTKVMNTDYKPLYTISSDIYHNSYIWQFADELGELKIFTISESVRTLLQTMYIRRGSPLAEPFNRLILRAGSAGFIDHYMDRIHYEERVKYKFHSRKQKKPQSLKGLRGVFTLLICGMCLSSISFIFEVLRRKF